MEKSRKGMVMRKGPEVTVLITLGSATLAPVAAFKKSTVKTREERAFEGIRSLVETGRGTAAFMAAELAEEAVMGEFAAAEAAESTAESRLPRLREVPTKVLLPPMRALGKEGKVSLSPPSVSLKGATPHWMSCSMRGCCGAEKKAEPPRASRDAWEREREGGGAAAIIEEGSVIGRRDTKGPQHGFNGGFTGSVAGAVPVIRMATMVMAGPQ